MNSEIKNKFLLTLSKVDRLDCKMLFERLESNEEEFGKDCSVFNQNEINEIFRSRTDLEDIQRDCSLIQQYCQFLGQQYFLYAHQQQKMTDKQPLKKILDTTTFYEEEEYNAIIQRAPSIFDKIFLQAMFEGVWISDKDRTFLTLNLAGCLPEENLVKPKCGQNKQVTDKLMRFLIEGAHTDAFEGISGNALQRAVATQVMQNDPTLCFKRIFVTENTTDDQIQDQTENYRERIKDRLKLDRRFKLPIIRISGMFAALRNAGIVGDYTNKKLYTTNPTAKTIADKYKFDYKRSQSDIHKTLAKYYKDVE